MTLPQGPRPPRQGAQPPRSPQGDLPQGVPLYGRPRHAGPPRPGPPWPGAYPGTYQDARADNGGSVIQVGRDVNIHATVPAGPPIAVRRRRAAGAIGCLGTLVVVVVGIALIGAHLAGRQVRGVTVRWTAGLADAQVGGPVVRGGSAYLADTDGDLYAVGAASGKTRWEHRFYYPIDATPAVTGSSVYVTSNGRLWAVSSATGAQLWSVPVAEASRGGVTAANGTVYVNGFTTVTAVDAATGQVRWSVSAGDILEAGTGPVVSGSSVYVVGASGTLYALDTATGAQRWQFATGMSNAAAASDPAVSGDTVYFVGGYQATAKLDALDAATGRVRWAYAPAAGQSPSYLDNQTPAVGGGLVYVSSTYGVASLHALDTATGRVRWTSEFPHPAATSPVLADGVVYVDDQQGDLSGLAQATGCRAWSDTQGLAQLDGTGNLVVAGGTIYIGATAYQIDRQPSSCRIT